MPMSTAAILDDEYYHWTCLTADEKERAVPAEED
jgi:hypothetical protein